MVSSDYPLGGNSVFWRGVFNRGLAGHFSGGGIKSQAYALCLAYKRTDMDARSDQHVDQYTDADQHSSADHYVVTDQRIDEYANAD